MRDFWMSYFNLDVLIRQADIDVLSFSIDINGKNV